MGPTFITYTIKAPTSRVHMQTITDNARTHRGLLTLSAVGAAALLAQPARKTARYLRRQQKKHSRKFGHRFLSPLATNAICGAVGEIAQIIAMYPVDTLKVQCQAKGTCVSSVLSCLQARQLGPLQLLRTMYAGCGSAATCSAIIGAAYLVTFYHTKGMLSRNVEKRAERRRRGDDLSSGFLPDIRSPTGVALAAAFVSSMMGSIFEAPMEMFKHRTQAGLIQGRMLNNMSAALRMNGVGALYSGYLAFILKSLPYDVAELVTYSELSRVQGPLQSIPVGCRDILTGACAGAAAVLASMPADCVKMRIELSGVTPRAGVLPSLVLFLGTARAMVRQGGLGALFVGMAPRLADKVPGTMVYWLAVEGCRRALQPYTRLGSAEETDTDSEECPGISMVQAAC